LQAVRNRRENALRLSPDENSRQIPKSRHVRQILLNR
jgi:hypothetical protein